MKIKLDKTTLPKDGQLVKFYDGHEWRNGEYQEEDECFYVNRRVFFFAWQIHEWEPINQPAPATNKQE
jgi:hypothetical protein